MTSASELFFTRRSRYGRTDPELGSDSLPGRISHHHSIHNRRRHHHNHQQGGNNIRRDRLDASDCEPLHRSPHRPRRFAPSERESIWLDSGSSQAASENITHAENGNRIRDGMRTSGSERLPGAVLLARERLLQRLRGVSISGNRRSNRGPTSTHRNNVTFEDDFRLADAGDWETDISRQWLAGTAPGTDSLWREKNKRPPGLSQEAVELLHIGVFSNSDKGDEETHATAVLECSICLDAFLEGDKLIYLPCGHRFHPCCLEPWVRSCGDCPYCRGAILVTSSCRTKEKS
ncbi:putative E3 ubiquitin-protein ligase RHY1A [Nicotiana tabacum]|uniref:E3 ubiquitin-protein ligase RLIM n=2 Tax=Nicotiana TaxID=4085 RepID=A0A1S4ACR1_TOBAC|nr:PREDICTED: E3 ubiquitin-protein ligase RLIM [Nicotiana sylvestris]XP_009783502.1 PREDICTED: E3 ubiquitin-protein ligase RLIM [Nicotiana sylvestris]XP_016474398.1 PREDICTED: E3 ubiquitin-protein ligase RLIM-like [Nicotiana tabacum]XP_016474399.1 PREDICTED: E3 ubiquitin-protein ligase RLIM-like [Nicotiana tabacum]